MTEIYEIYELNNETYYKCLTLNCNFHTKYIYSINRHLLTCKENNDLIKCSRLPVNSEICFIDDTYYPEMANDNVYYINIKPYYYDLSFEYMFKKLMDSEIGKKIIGDDNEFEKLMMENINLFKYIVIKKDDKEYEVDKVIGKHIISHLQTFFNRSSKNRTIKNRDNKRNKTLKRAV
jgi:hypothetical protein